MLEVQVNGNPTSHLSTPCSGKSPSPSPSSPATDFRPSRESQGSSISLASTKVCNSLAEGDGPVTELEDEIPAVPVSISERYRVGRTLGDGNFAVVRECVEHSTGREYALKIINKGRRRGKVRWGNRGGGGGGWGTGCGERGRGRGRGRGEEGGNGGVGQGERVVTGCVWRQGEGSRRRGG
uniref:Doublecortin like kinase 1 n=1 Tax=Oncorhynchus kisutch TaxID=8019 RepID=A0A8C7JQJ3_ONCKI